MNTDKSTSKPGNKKMRKYQLILIDALCLLAIFLVACGIDYIVVPQVSFVIEKYLLKFGLFLVLLLSGRLVVGIYNNVWRYANSRVYLKMVLADLAGGLLGIAVCWLLSCQWSELLQLAMLVALFNIMTLSSRFVYQQYYRHLNVNLNDINKIGVAIAGAGQAGTLLAEDLLYNGNSNYKPICFIDTDNDKIGKQVCGLKIYPEEGIFDILKNMPIQEVIIAISDINSEKVEKLYEFYSQHNWKVKVFDFPFNARGNDYITNKREIREIRIEDLLFRDSIKINSENVQAYYTGKVILVTGGGGSIGSELCRQIAKHNPRQLIILDIYENNAYEIQQELIRKYGNSLNLAVEIASVRDLIRMEAVFAHYRPQIVFHAAAHKHVPLMEHSSCEAIKNNILGTYKTANLAEKYQVDKFILISTDKAVNPTNVMGASKRMCEMIIQCRTDSHTAFSAVRFGNVLGSNGSVIPLFRTQIENGGPVTITDKRIIRYFMTIPEASQLVMEAGVMASNGELFVLDMGNPIKILDLAENMIQLSGYRPYKDIDIVEIGLRPGEKLYEELLIKTENLNMTQNKLIFVEYDTPLSRKEVDEKILVLQKAVRASEKEISSVVLKEAMKQVVPSYRDPEEVNKRAANSEEMQKANDSVNSDGSDVDKKNNFQLASM